MSEDDGNAKSPELKDLVDSYRKTQAPMGFAGRVAVRVREQNNEKPAYRRYFKYTIPAAAIVVITVITVQVINIEKPGSTTAQVDLSKQDKITTAHNNNTSPVTSDAATSTTDSDIGSSKVFNTASLGDPEQEGFANVAVMSDVTYWLDKDSDTIVIDYFELPDLAEMGILPI